MRGFLAVARREIGERKLVLVAAAFAGLIAFLVPLTRGLHGADASDARQWTALILAVAFAIGISIGLGLATLGGEIANRRAGFYWARPISGWALWAGKLLGVWLLALLAALLAFAPSLLVDGRRVLSNDLPSIPPGALLLALLGFVAASHAVGIVARSRSALLLVDVVAMALAYAATHAIRLPLLRLFAGNAAQTNLLVAQVFIGVGALAGGAAAVVVGRTQIRNAHRALSIVLWSVVACGLMVQLARTAWVVSARPQSVRRIDSMDPGGARGWVTLMGEARESNATFAFNVEDGRFARVPTTFRPVAFSQNGRRAVWFESDGRRSEKVIAWDLDRPNGRPRSTHVTLTSFAGVAFLSPDGSRLATYDYELLSVYDLATGKLFGSARAPGHLWPGQGLFVAPGRVRLFLAPAALDTRIAILDFDFEARRLWRTAVIEGVRLEPFWTVRSDGNQVIVRDQGAERTTLYDGITGKPIAVLLEGSDPAWVPACFISGGRVAVISNQGSRIRIVTADGQIEKDFGLPAPAFALLGEPAEGRLSLALRRMKSVGILDLGSGKLEELAALRATPGSFWRQQSAPAPPGDGYSALFCTEGGSLVRVDPITLRQKTILAVASQ